MNPEMEKMEKKEKIENNDEFKLFKDFKPLDASKADAFWDAINYASKADAFWDAINFEIGTTSSSPPDENKPFQSQYSFQEGGGVVSSSKDNNSHKLRKSLVPPSFSKPHPSCFVQYYAPLEPLILLPNHFSTTPESLEKLSVSIEDYLKSRDDVEFSSSGSSWSGSIIRVSAHSEFRFCVYRSREIGGLYIIEGQRVRGDGFLFGDLYQGIRNLFFGRLTLSRSSSAPSVEIVSESGESNDSDSRKFAESVKEIVAESGESNDSDSRKFAESVKEMINSEDSQVALNGIKFAGELCVDQVLRKDVYNSNLVTDFVKTICCETSWENKWVITHAWYNLALLAKRDASNFNSFISDNQMNGRTLRLIIIDEIDKIRQRSTTEFWNTSSNLHMLKCANSIFEKLSSSMDESV